MGGAVWHPERMTTIAVLGAGKIGESLLSGLLAAGHDAGALMFTERYPDRAAELTERYGITSADVADAVRTADVLVVAVKPQDVDPVLAELGSVPAGTVVVSMCAGLPISLFERRLPANTPVVRVMPNTPMLVSTAMSAVAAGAHVDKTHLDLVDELLGSVGRVVHVPEEQLDTVTAVSGSGPAYFFYVVEALIEGGVAMGLPRATAAELVVQTAAGSAEMLRAEGAHPAALREGVSSPAGTTIAGLRELDRNGVRAALVDAVEAARDRSVALGRVHRVEDDSA